MKLFGEGKKDNGQTLPLDLVNKISLESAWSVEYNVKEADCSNQDQGKRIWECECNYIFQDV